MCKYVPNTMNTEEGSPLYQRWIRIKKSVSPEFSEFPSFYEWAMKSGYSPSSYLIRKDSNLPYSPDNCFWRKKDKDKLDYKYQKSATEWNRFVNRVRRAYGLPAFAEMNDDQKGEEENG